MNRVPAPDTSKKRPSQTFSVYLAACSAIAEKLEPFGFRFTKSGPRLKKQISNFVCEISFETSHLNKLDGHIALRVSAYVRSPQLKKWRSNQPYPYRPDDFVAGGMLHLLTEPPAPLLEWDLSKRQGRDQTVMDVFDHINELVLPYFERYTDIGSLISQLSHQIFPAMEIGSAVELALCFDTRQNAQAILNRYIEQHTNLINDIETSVAMFGEEGLPDRFVTAYTQQVAWIKVAYGLK